VVEHVSHKMELTNAALERDFIEVRRLVNEGRDVNAVDQAKMSVVHRVALQNDAEMVALVLELGGDINARDHLQQTPIHLASIHGATQVIEVLAANACIDINARDVMGNTPLHVASRHARISAISTLLKNGADERKTVVGLTAWDLGVWFPAEPFTRVACQILLITSHYQRIHRIKLMQHSHAFAMGNHERLGAESHVRVLEPNILRMIFELM
jgi:ankyrin repeat protein